MPPLASVNNSGMSKGGMQTGGRFVVRSRTPPELERVSFFFSFSCNPVICNPDFLWLFQLRIYVGVLSGLGTLRMVLRIMPPRTKKVKFLSGLFCMQYRHFVVISVRNSWIGTLQIVFVLIVKTEMNKQTYYTVGMSNQKTPGWHMKIGRWI